MESIETRRTSTWIVGEALVILSLIIALLLSIDPTRSVDKLVIIKYLPLILVNVATLILITQRIKINVLTNPYIASMFLLVVIMIAGSAMNLVDNGRIHETFLGRGLGLTPILAGALIATNNSSLRIVAKRFTIILIVISLIGFFQLFMHEIGLLFPNQRHILHVETTFFAAGAFWVALKWQNIFIQIIIVSFLLWLGIQSGKTTAVLLSLIIGLALTVIRTQRLLYSSPTSFRTTSTLARKALYIYITLLTVLTSLILMISVSLERASRYENDLRFKIWTFKWAEFKSSPLVGNLYTDSPIYETIHLFNVKLSTHNDYLDHLSSGGILGFSLFVLLPVSIILNKRFYNVIFTKGVNRSPETVFALIFICYLVSSTGNPILPVPRFSVLVWFAMGVLSVTITKKMKHSVSTQDNP